MKRPQTVQLSQQQPKPTGDETRVHLLERAHRPTVPIRKTFVQKPPGANPRHGPLSSFVRGGDLRGLRAYLITIAATSAENDDGWTTEFDSAVWGRLFDAHLYASDQAARTAAARILDRLEQRNLIRCSRKRGSRKIAVTLLREDASGAPYTRPNGKTSVDRFLRLPRAFWTRGFDSKIDFPGLVMLLAVAAEKPWSSFPAEKMDEWYGWSSDTTLRGFQKLMELQLVERRKSYKKAPLSPSGSTVVYQYQLPRWMRPKAQPRPEGMPS
jgi:hypothetical protein